MAPAALFAAGNLAAALRVVFCQPSSWVANSRTRALLPGLCDRLDAKGLAVAQVCNLLYRRFSICGCPTGRPAFVRRQSALRRATRSFTHRALSGKFLTAVVDVVKSGRNNAVSSRSLLCLSR